MNDLLQLQAENTSSALKLLLSGSATAFKGQIALHSIKAGEFLNAFEWMARNEGRCQVAVRMDEDATFVAFETSDEILSHLAYKDVIAKLHRVKMAANRLRPEMKRRVDERHKKLLSLSLDDLQMAVKRNLPKKLYKR